MPGMGGETFRPFVVSAEDAGGDTYRITAEFQGALRSEIIPAALPLIKRNERQQALQWMEDSRLDRAFVRDFGTRLFRTLFTGAILTLFREAAQSVGASGMLRVVLRLPASLSDLPWELMYDAEGQHGFLARSTSAPLSRHFAGLPIPHDLPSTSPLRVLLVSASPTDFTPVSGEGEVKDLDRELSTRRLGMLEALRLALSQVIKGQSLREAWRSLRHREMVEIETLRHATREMLQHRLAESGVEKAVHVVHFIGHGVADDRESAIMLEKPDGTSDPITAEEFAELIWRPSVGMVMLNACETAAPLQLFNGAAQQALRRGVPVVIGMQTPILDRHALELAREFYGAWAGGETIEGALAYARRLVRAGAKGEFGSWGIPVLYAGPDVGLRLSLPTPDLSPALKRLRWAVGLVGFLILTGIPTLFFYRSLLPPTAQPMTRLFNVVVADFGEVDKATDVPARASDDGRWLAQNVFDEFSARLDALPELKAKVAIQHDYVGIVPGETAEARHNSAAKLALDLNADIVVYGNIDRGRLPFQFVPDFYVSPRLTGAEEATGPATFGAPMHMWLPIRNRPDNAARLTSDFLPRTEALTQFMFGLAFLKANLPDAALERFELARAVPQWDDKRGKEVLYLWIGTAHLERATGLSQPVGPPCEAIARKALDLRLPETPSGESVSDFDCARTAYQIAQKLNPRYSRADLGLGKVWFDLVEQQFATQGGGDCGAYELAADFAQQAVGDRPDAAQTAFVPLKAHLNSGVAYANGFANNCDPAWGERAVTILISATREYAQIAAPPPLAQDLAARAYFQLGRSYLGLNRLDDATPVLKRVVDIATPTGDYEDEWQAIRWNARYLQGLVLEAQARAGNAERWPEAMSEFDSVVQRFLDGKLDRTLLAAGAAQHLASAYIETGRPDVAVKQAAIAIDLTDGTDIAEDAAKAGLPWQAFVDLGQAHVLMAKTDAGHWQLAREALDRVVDPATVADVRLDTGTLARALLLSGQVYEQLGAREQARAGYERALMLDQLGPEQQTEIENRLRAVGGSH
jgi:tetratricopeptide (TPR) repeat protein